MENAMTPNTIPNDRAMTCKNVLAAMRLESDMKMGYTARMTPYYFFNRKVILCCALAASGLFSFATIANATTTSNARTSLQGTAIVASAYRVTLLPGEYMKYRIGFKNTSKKTWVPGVNKFTVKTVAKKESYLYTSQWMSRTSPARLTERIAPGRIGYVEFAIEAPKKTGRYSESFFLTENGVRALTLPLSLATDVVRQKNKTPPPRAIVALQTPKVSAVRLIQSNKTLTLVRNQKTIFRVGFKNSGTASWNADSKLVLRAYAARESYFADASWETGNSVTTIKDSISPGELLIIPFVVHAPIIAGTFSERFILYQDGKPLPATQFDVPLVVVNPPTTTLAHSSENIQAELSKQLDLLDSSTGNAIMNENATSTQSILVRPGIIDDKQESEPLIRAGLFSSDTPITITANKPFLVTNSTGAILYSEAAKSHITISFDSVASLFTISNASASSTATHFVRFFGAEKNSLGQNDQDIIFEIPSYERRPSWNKSLNDNLFRGVLEVKHAPLTNRVWVINELFLESYLKGIAESSNNAPFEYHKALIVAARTYAKYHINRGTKYASEGYTVRTTDADQVYRGYGAEMRLPQVSRAVEETRGVMVMYNKLLAITPYFSQSDGRTRSWEEVWAGGPYPWLIGKDDPTNKGLPLLGHGVGMSARGAVGMALSGNTFEEILTYYYTGVELRRRY